VGGWDAWREQKTCCSASKLTGTEIRVLEIGTGFFTNLRKTAPFQTPQLDLSSDVTVK